tara:strand:+ start:2942 stop:3076 length:135 start_codon:yes stop_codon:yes gene_type:complete
MTQAGFYIVCGMMTFLFIFVLIGILTGYMVGDEDAPHSTYEGFD